MAEITRSSSNEDILRTVNERARTQASRILMGSGQQHALYIDGPDGNQYKFVVKRPNMGDLTRIGCLKGALLSQYGVPSPQFVDVTVQRIATIVATLRVVVVEAPEGFNPEEAEDDGILYDIYEGYANWLRTFRRGDGAAAAGDSAATPAEAPLANP